MGKPRSRLLTLLAPIRARLSQRQYLVVHLAAGFIFAVIALWIFIAITEGVVHHDRLTRIDASFASWLHSHITARATAFFQGVSFLGSPAVVGTLGVVIAVGLAVTRRWRTLIALLAAFAGSGAINWAIKTVVRRPRPEFSFANVHDASFSFPSGHAMGSLVAYGMLAYLLTRYAPQNRHIGKIVYSLAAALVLAIGISRLYLEVHYLSDVIGGYFAGAIWLTVCISGVELSDFENEGKRS